MTKDGLLCIVMLDEYEHNIQFWVWDTVLSSAAKWVLRKTVLLDIPLPLELQLYWPALRIVWFKEENNVIFLWTHTGIVMFNLESMKCMKVSEEIRYNKIYPYSSFMTAGRDVGLLSVDEVHDRFTKAILQILTIGCSIKEPTILGP
ncbi:unnamed protein product [Miscanthus lutarioriparius]|uniref:Uncharacterized protein n=1 Tax=Miscanthus lutarioriparius TaxID=422564 RepID=A0A811QS45_9POAL|nr:unnamed protein product [Miscanthus lutarioriparius]